MFLSLGLSGEEETHEDRVARVVAEILERSREAKRATDRARYAEMRSDPKKMERKRQTAAAWAARNHSAVYDTHKRWTARNAEREKERGRAWYAANREEQQTKNRARYHGKLKLDPEFKKRNLASQLKSKYGLTISRSELLATQGGLCGICGTDDPRKGHWVVEHDHDTDKVRSISHFKCNAGLGLFLEDPAALRAAADYVEKHKVRASAP